jgi:exonuclease SbcC
MITKICLNNFMAHIDTVIELGPGLNVIIGPNNCGKSAIVAALETVCYNKAGQKQNRDYAISHGSKEASVTVETSEGHVLVWNKKKGSGGDWYKINGREVHRVRGKYPDDLHDYLRLPIVLINNGKDEVPIHFAHQKDPIFLIDQPPQRAAEFFAASSDVARLLEMRKLHQSRTRERKREQNRLKKDLAEIDERLQRLAPLSEIDGKIKEAATEHQVIEKAEQSLKQARRTVEQVQRRTREVDEFVQYYDALKSLKALPKLAETEALQQVIRRQKRLEKSIRFGGWQAEAYTPLSSPPELEPTKSLSKLLNRCSD